MPTLPSITINDTTVWNRVFNAFHGDQAEYKTWLIAVLKSEVMRRECQAIRDQADQNEQNTINDLKNVLSTLS